MRFRYESGAIEGAIKSFYDVKQVVDDLEKLLDAEKGETNENTGHR